MLQLNVSRWTVPLFFSLIVFGVLEAHLSTLYSLLLPLSEQLHEVIIIDSSPSKDWHSTVGWGDFVGFEPEIAG
jgi:hypothetical protein